MTGRRRNDASVGSKGDSFGNAKAESFNGLNKSELIDPKGPWRGLDDVEFATLSFVDWINNRRLHGEIEPDPGFTTPAAFEAATTVNSTQLNRPRLKPPCLYETRGASLSSPPPLCPNRNRSRDLVIGAAPA